MKRDMDLIRQILLKTEEMPFWKAESTGLEIEDTLSWREKSTGPNIRRIEDYRDTDGFLDLGKYLGIEGYSTEKISYHVKIIAEADLIEQVEIPANQVYAEYAGTIVYIPTGLTWWGHEFLEAVKDDARWRKVKSIMGKTGGFVFQVASSVAIKLLEGQVSSLLPSP
jgi:hypothetical protein